MCAPRDGRAHLMFSSAWGACPWRVYVGSTPVLHFDNRADAVAWRDRFNAEPPVEVTMLRAV